MRAFLATAQEGSLSAAARALGSTQPTIGRQVAALEAELGVMLFERVGKTLVITNSGQDLLEHVQVMGDAASRISMVATSQSQSVSGRVSVTASDLFAAAYLPQILKTLRRTAPGLEIDIIASNHIEDLTRRDADIAVRNVRPTQPDLIARLIGHHKAGLFAAKSYLDERGRPQALGNLAGHDFIGVGDREELVTYLQMQGIHLTPSQIRYTADNGVVMWELMRAGLGITTMPNGIWPSVTDVEHILPDMEPLRFPMWLATHRELHTSRRIRIVYDALADALGKLPQY
ncbi:LysR family transcriptional regulator [Yoonia tamlensis]|uniref:LysR family transcriptional regulator n=1 Tax=Yoonia tamlensis TaxID=390270 RepID=UPI002683A0E6|nr:LysR family transcriptional regulator [Yoonia tamlensis]